MTLARTPLMLLALAACDLFGPARLPAPPPPPIVDTRPAPRPVVRSCPATATPVAVDLDPRVALGEHGGVTWLYGLSAGQPVLAHLGADDRLALTPVPLPHAETGAIADGRIWLYASSPSPRWLSVDITDPERPVPGAVDPVTLDASVPHPVKLTVGRSRALALLGAFDQLELVLLDTATRTNVAPAHALAPTFRPHYTSCSGDDCSIVAVDHAPGAEPARQIVVLRVAPDGTREQEQLASEWRGEPRVARHGDQILVAWLAAGGVRLRALDRSGHPLAPSVPVPWDSKRPIHDLRLFQADGAVVLAVAEDDRWSVAPVGPHGNPGPLRALTGATLRSLYAAPLGDGLAWINVGDDFDPAEVGAGVLTSALQAEVLGGFLPTTGDATPPRSLAGACVGGPRLEPHLLTRPGAAAALIVPRGHSDDFAGPTLALLRATCKPDPPVVVAPAVDGPVVDGPVVDGLAVDVEKCRDE